MGHSQRLVFRSHLEQLRIPFLPPSFSSVKVSDVYPGHCVDRERQVAVCIAENAFQLLGAGKDREGEGWNKELEFDAAAEFAELTSTRSGGVSL